MNIPPSHFIAAFCLAPIAASAQLAAPTPPVAQDTIHQAGACDTTNGQLDCARVIACIGVDGKWFNGRAMFGRGEGALEGQLSTGAACKGHWVARNFLGLGQADVKCNDGMTVTILYTVQDTYTGTAIGYGSSNRGEPIKAWSGQNVLAYFQNENPDNPVITLHCGLTSIPLS
jgi:hypothetical protein